MRKSLLVLVITAFFLTKMPSAQSMEQREPSFLEQEQSRFTLHQYLLSQIDSYLTLQTLMDPQELDARLQEGLLLAVQYNRIQLVDEIFKRYFNNMPELGEDWILTLSKARTDAQERNYLEILATIDGFLLSRWETQRQLGWPFSQ